MSKLNIDQKTIKELFQDSKADFLIPDYQRPYAWGEDECQTLWDDIFSFAIPNDDATQFNDSADEYFLGPIVTYINNNRQEIIDGQQRLTTLMLLLRAFYDRFENMKDKNSIVIRENIEKCIWKTDIFGTPNKLELKIDSEVATDNDKTEFLTILKTGIVGEKHKSRYAQNYKFFQNQISEFLTKYPSFCAHLPARILNNCILLPIEAESQDTALRIFSTLNDRGLPLSDSDIFKAQFYKYYSEKNEKDDFIKRWKDLEELCAKIFHPISGSPMDEIFTRYMYYVRATKGITSSTTEALRKFYEKEKYTLLKRDDTLKNIEDLADFWNDVSNQDADKFSETILKKLFVLNYAPNSMWTYFVSVYFMTKKDTKNMLDEKGFGAFLDRITAFIWAYSVFKPGVNSLRTPVYAEMVNLVEGRNVDFENFKFDEDHIKSMFHNYGFYNARPITKSMLAWWAYNNPNQELMKIETSYDIEHIFARNRVSHDTLQNKRSLDILGNKAMLEKRINIRASDYKFEDKKKYYKGYTNARNQEKEGTQIVELLQLADEKADFTEQDIITRDNSIIDGFVEFLKTNGLIQA